MVLPLPKGTPTLELRDVSKASVPLSRCAREALPRYRLNSCPRGRERRWQVHAGQVIAGLYHRDSGTFELEGQPVDFKSTAESKAAGIAVIYQEPTLFPDLTVTENIFMGRQPIGRSVASIERRCAKRSAV